MTPTERQRLKDEFDIHVEALWSTITCDVKDTLTVERGLPSQEMERQFGLLREMTMRPMSSLPDGYAPKIKELKQKVEDNILESEESLSVLREDMVEAEKQHKKQQSEMEEYEKSLQQELQEKLKEKKEMIKEAQDDYESTKASVEEVESSKAATEQFNTILSNTEFCLKEIAGIFPELERLYIQPVEDVTRKRKVLSDIMMKMKKKREDAATSSAAGALFRRKRTRRKSGSRSRRECRTVRVFTHVCFTLHNRHAAVHCSNNSQDSASHACLLQQLAFCFHPPSAPCDALL